MAENTSENLNKQAIAAEFGKGGIGAVRDYVQSNLDRWRTATVSIAIIGGAGVGKSTFINKFRNVKDDEPGSALTGVTETTIEIDSYQDPINPNIKLFDLPGVGTDRFPKNEYLKRIEVDRFDTFLLMTSVRFTENDLWLAGELKEKKKPFFFVRTKVWNDVENSNRNVSKKIPAEQITVKIRTNCKKELKNKDVKIFLIDSFNERKEMLDFKKLRVAMSEDLPELKKQALFDAYRDFTMFTPLLIKKKGEMLRTRIWKAALLSGTMGLIPIPGVSLFVDLGIVNKEREFFANQLGIGSELSINERAFLSEGTLREITRIADTWWKTLSKEVIRGLAISAGAETAASFIPFIGLIVSAVTSFWGTKIVLGRLLDTMIEDALKINALTSNDFSKDVEV